MIFDVFKARDSQVSIQGLTSSVCPNEIVLVYPLDIKTISISVVYMPYLNTWANLDPEVLASRRLVEVVSWHSRDRWVFCQGFQLSDVTWCNQFETLDFGDVNPHANGKKKNLPHFLLIHKVIMIATNYNMWSLLRIQKHCGKKWCTAKIRLLRCCQNWLSA